MDYTQLKEEIEKCLGKKIRTPKDFEQLSDEIFNATHQKLSPTTLKRIWGYVQDSSKPRESTLDIIAQFLNYESWKHFCVQKYPPQ